MRIGIDIDGVLTDCERFMLDYGAKFAKENNLPIQVKLGEYNDAEMLGMTEEQVVEFWRTYIIDYFSNYPARQFAKEVIEKLREEGHEIYILTARNEYGIPPEYKEKENEITKEWLNKNGIQYDKLIFTENSKLTYCVGNYVELMIDDCDKVIREISDKIPTICFNNYWNANVAEGKNVTRVYSWYEVYEKIQKMCK